MSTLNKRITISAVFSDLFFNHTHTKFDVEMASSKSTPEEREKAIVEDAQQFVKDYGSIIAWKGPNNDGDGMTVITDYISSVHADVAEALAADFLERL